MNGTALVVGANETIQSASRHRVTEPSDGLPVLVIDGRAVGPNDLPPGTYLAIVEPALDGPSDAWKPGMSGWHFAGMVVQRRAYLVARLRAAGYDVRQGNTLLRST